MRRLALLCCSLWVILGVPAAAGSGRRIAIVIGIDRYERPDITPLTCAVNDAHLLAESLRAVHFDKVYEMTSALSKDSDYYPTSNNIGFQLGNVRKIFDQEGGSDNTFVFYFSGHGMELAEAGKSKGETYLVAVDTDIRNDDVLKRSAYRYADIRDIIERIHAKNVLVVLDACRNDPHGGGRTTADNRLSADSARGLTIAKRPGGEAQVMATLFACSPGERSYEWSKKGHGYFTYYLVEGLKGQAASQGNVTLKGLAEYCARAVKNATQDAGYTQTPWLNSDGPPDWVVETSSDAALVGKVKDEPVAVATHNSKKAIETSDPPTTVATPAPTPQFDNGFVGTWKVDFMFGTMPVSGLRINHPDGTFEDFFRDPRTNQPTSAVRSGLNTRFSGGIWLEIITRRIDPTDVFPLNQEVSGTYQWTRPGQAFTHQFAGVTCYWTKLR